MRRVAVSNAKPGMTVARAVFDTRGHIVHGEGDKLTVDNLGLLIRSGAAEILIEDPRVADVLVGSLFSPHLEAKAVQALSILLALQQGSTEGVRAQDLIGIEPVVHHMAKRLFPNVLGDPELSGLTSTQAYDTIHPVKVAGLSMLVGRHAGLEEADIVKLGLACMLENLGNLAVPQAILEKQGSLTDDEWQQVHRHPKESVTMLADSGLDPKVIEAIEQHHERWSGSGYPDGRKGEEIAPFARIIALADTYHALLSARPYRPAFKPHEAAEFIVAYSGDAFDPELTRIFARRVPQYPAGLGVRLSTGEVGIISNPNAGHIARPIVRICFDNGNVVDEPYDLDLSERKCMNKLVVEVLL